MRSVARKWEVPDTTTPYLYLEGKLDPAAHQELYRRAVSNPEITLPFYQEENGVLPVPQRADFHFWEDGYPLEIRTRKQGRFRLLGPVHAPTMQWVLSLPPDQIRIDERTEMSAILTLLKANCYVLDDHREHAIIHGVHTDRDREQLREWIVHGYGWSYLIPAYLAAHLPPHWKPVPPTASKKRYRDAFLALAALLPDRVRCDKATASVHRFLQVCSGWPGDVVQIPADIRIVNPEAEAEQLAQRRQELRQQERSARIFAALFPHPEAIPSELLFVDYRRTVKVVLDSLPEDRLNRVMTEFGLTRAELEKEVSKPLLSLRYRRGQTSGEAQAEPCRACGGPIEAWGPSQRTITALRGTKIPICGRCYASLAPRAIENRVPAHPRRVVTSREELIQVIRELAELTGALPTAEPEVFLARLPVEQLPQAATLLARMPWPEQQKKLFPGGWLELIAAAGLLEIEHRQGVGIWCSAEDGHPCRSVAEKVIDDWLFRHGTAHKIEPPYPFDEELNPNGMRADFRVGSTLIEYFGLMNREGYAARAATKRRLAARRHLDLIELYPEDLTDAGLQAKLGRLLGNG